MDKTRVIDRDKLLSELEALSVGRQLQVADFISYLKVREELEATKEILEDQDFLESILRGDEDIREGRVTSWRKVREDV